MKKTALAAGVTAAVVALAGCSGPDGDAPGGDIDISDKAMTAEIQVGAWESDFDWDAVIAGFNEQYPGITVNVTKSPFADYFTSLQTQASGNNLPDVFMMNGPNFQLYASNDQLTSLQPVVDSGDLDPTKFPDALNALYTYDGTPYAVPTSYDSIGLWYNKALFEEAGIDLPTDEWTWDDLHKAAKSISDALGQKGVYGFAGGAYNQELTYNLIFQAGGAVLNEDATAAEYSSEGTREALQFLRDMVKDGSSPSIQATSDTSPDELFKSGKAAMIYGGSFRVAGYADSDVADDVQVVRMPIGKERGVALHGSAVVASAKGDQRNAAAAFVTYVGSEQAQQIIGTSGTTIPAYEGTGQAYVDAYPQYDLQVYLDTAEEYGFEYPVSANTQAWIAVESETVPKILSGDLSVEEGTKQLDADIDALLAEESKE